MRALLLNANHFGTRLVEESNKPVGIIPEVQKAEEESMDDCLVVFFCVEKEDDDSQVESLYDEIVKAAEELATTKVLCSPFVHLSNNIAESEHAKNMYQLLLEKVNKESFEVGISHFGYHKSLQLDIKGHPGSFRYREFN